MTFARGKIAPSACASLGRAPDLQRDLRTARMAKQVKGCQAEMSALRLDVAGQPVDPVTLRVVVGVTRLAAAPVVEQQQGAVGVKAAEISKVDTRGET